MILRPFNTTVSDGTLKDLRTRLEMTRFPSTPAPTSDQWLQGVPLPIMQSIIEYWRTEYDMARLERVMNSYPQFTAMTDGMTIHFWHIKSSSKNAIPMLLIHGWPGSVLEFRHVIDNLTHPAAGERGFHLVIPSLPGYGFSSAPSTPGLNFEKTGELFGAIMNDLGYADIGYVVQGGDFGADIVAAMAHQHLQGLRSVHMNSAFFDAEAEFEQDKVDGIEATESSRKALALQRLWKAGEDAYFEVQRTRPQTLGYSLTDSPVGLLGWIMEKIVLWSEHSTLNNDQLSGVIDLEIDEILDNIMLYWVTNTSTSSLRMYWEAQADNTALQISGDIPVGVSLFQADMSWASQHWAERYYERLVHFKEINIGGHFAAWERPMEFVSEIRTWISKAI